MSIKLQFINATDEHVKDGKKDYHKLTVTYKNLDSGKVEVKNLLSFGTDKNVWDQLTKASTNDTFSVETEKNDKGYWQWVDIARLDGVEVAAVKPATTQVSSAGYSAPAKTNTYEVNNMIQQERLAFDREKQPLIVRQSCLAQAVAFVGSEAGIEQVLEVANQFVDWVNGESEEVEVS